MATLAKIFLGLWIAAGVAAAFLWLPPVENFPDPALARLVALHLPNAMVVIVAAFTAGTYGARYLKTRSLLDDAKSQTAAALAALFCLLTTATGSVFARVQWGAYWNWDPKQICIFLLLLIYAAYFALRSGIEDADRKAAISAVYVLFATVMTPLLGYVVPKYMPSLHPTNTHFDARYHLVIWGLSFGLIGLFAWMQNLAARASRAQLALASLEFDAEETRWIR